MPPRNIFESTYLFVTRFITIIYYNIRDHFDPIPPWGKGEHAMEYLTRIDRKYAIRFIDRQLWGVPDWNIDLLDLYMNSAEFPEEKRETFEGVRKALETRQMYATIKEALLNN